jgi:hypothetical protein
MSPSQSCTLKNRKHQGGAVWILPQRTLVCPNSNFLKMFLERFMADSQRQYDDANCLRALGDLIKD